VGDDKKILMEEKQFVGNQNIIEKCIEVKNKVYKKSEQIENRQIKVINVGQFQNNKN
jgi:hypothetical protein